MKFNAWGYRLPKCLSNVLFGDRERYGYQPDLTDPCWRHYLDILQEFYVSTQKTGIGKVVNNAGYKVLRNIDFSDKSILEVGPGGLNHIPHWQGKPKRYVMVDLYDKFLINASERLAKSNVSHESRITSRDNAGVLPCEESEFDIVVSFYSLEHLYPLARHLNEIHRVLKPGGTLIGAIPSEGGLLWGIGRYLTTRRWIKSNTNINPDKIICWEHPNFADGILASLVDRFKLDKIKYWPFRFPLIDINLIIMFQLKKTEN